MRILSVFLLLVSSLGGLGATTLRLGGANWALSSPPVGPSEDGIPPGTLVDLLALDEFLVAPGGGDWGAFAFAPGSYKIDFLYEFAALAAVNEVWGVALLDLNQRTLFFSGSAGPGATTYFASSSPWVLMGRTVGNVEHYSSLIGTSHWALGRVSGTGVLYAGFEDSSNPRDDFQDVFLGVASVPEPAAFGLLALGLCAVGVLRRR